MCNLYSSTKPVEAMRQLFDVPVKNVHLGNAEPLAAIWPKYPGYVMRHTKDGERELVTLSWGFRTTKVSKKTGKTLQPAAWNNARDNKVATSGLWRGSFQQRRCLVPATSFCEAKGRNPATYYWFGLDGGEERPLFAFAGLWTVSQFEGPDGPDRCEVYTIITTSANDLVKPVHPDRMPVIVPPEKYETWMAGSADDALEVLEPYPADQMKVFKSGENEKDDALPPT
ncbi:SOS response-associated peptidase [Roseovarius sp. CAU 1744]|uniref:SOS response-associated peptidase n=1 Tax=Roseovarius sp. CAU 1744 TaxID=3140368 RepID=UPI00325B7395